MGFFWCTAPAFPTHSASAGPVASPCVSVLQFFQFFLSPFNDLRAPVRRCALSSARLVAESEIPKSHSDEMKSAPSEARLRANRLNAQNSSGPKSVEGKKRSSLNATRHGILSQTVHFPEE